MMLSFGVQGIPGPQGSKVAFKHKHTGKVLTRESSPKVAPWRTDVKTAAEQALLASDEWERAYPGPVIVWVAFRFLRPTSHYRAGRNAHLLRDRAPTYPTGRDRGDLDKLLRSTFDALTAAGVISDDSHITEAAGRKVWCTPGQSPGAHITLWALEPAESDTARKEPA